MSATHPIHTRFALVSGLALLLAACGGGGSSSGTAAEGTSSSAASATPVQLSGVAAFGAPLSGAALKVIDARGKAVGSGSTNPADGSFTLSLSTATPTLPLLLQAAGFDATGQPLLLHSALPALAATSSTAVVNITPLTEAAVALTLGTEPKKVFALPASYATQLAGLAQLGPASEFVKSLVKPNLADAKAGTLTSLDLFADPAFAATKSGVDLALETLSVGIGSSLTHRDQLQLANKLGSKLVEVTVDLANASAELAKATGASPTTAITSALKATTSPTTLVTRLASLDALVVSVNAAIAAGGGSSAASALTAAYTRHNGRDAAALAGLIAAWAQQGTQLGRLQVTGCADAPATGTASSTAVANCTKVAVAARLSDTTGKEAGSFSDVVAYNATSTKWALVGNGLAAELSARAVAWLALNADGGRLAGQTPNPRTGIRLGVQTAAGLAAVQTPSNYVLSFVPCGQAWLCISPSAGSTGTVGSGTPVDQAVFQGSSAWMGSADVSVGASYGFTLTPSSGSATSTAVALRSGFADAPADSRFPSLDDVKASQPLSGATLLAGTRLAWQAWAAANPDMRLAQVRLVLTSASAGEAPLLFDAQPAQWRAGGLDWAAVNLPANFMLGGVTLWLIATDASGRQYDTGYVVVAAP